jgi:lysozyme family protein
MKDSLKNNLEAKTMTIAQLISAVIAKEGGYVNHPNDRGGPTKYGITRKTYADYIGNQGNGTQPTPAQIKAISKALAAEIYKKLYYIRPNINMLNEAVQPIVFDMAVNHGPERAITLLQRELAENGYSIGAIDGIIGKKTLAATDKAIAAQGAYFINYLVNRRITFYRHIIENDPTQAAFKDGWFARAESFRPEVAEA